MLLHAACCEPSRLDGPLLSPGGGWGQDAIRAARGSWPCVGDMQLWERSLGAVHTPGSAGSGTTGTHAGPGVEDSGSP